MSNQPAPAPALTLEGILDRMYASEENARIACFWDAGWEVRLGDEINGWKEIAQVDTVAEIVPVLHALLLKHYPDSSYARQAAIAGGLLVPTCEVCGRNDLCGIVNGYSCWRCGQLWLEANLARTP